MAPRPSTETTCFCVCSGNCGKSAYFLDGWVAEPLTPELFAKFGGVISSKHQIATAQSASANYGTATKLFKVSPVTNKHSEAEANFNLFRCSPPVHLIHDHQADDQGLTYLSKVLERHPQSTQTFIPMGRSAKEFAYMVIVAPSDPENPQRLPLLSQTEAFLCHGDQAVTYGVGTWHAPMIALGQTTDFAVLIHETGDDKVDTEEVAMDQINVEFYTTKFSESKRKPQTEEEFAIERAKYKGPVDPSSALQSGGQLKMGDSRYDSKQVKYAVEREYFARNWEKVIELVDSLRVEGKLQNELDDIKTRALRKRDSEAGAI